MTKFEQINNRFFKIVSLSIALAGIIAVSMGATHHILTVFIGLVLFIVLKSTK